MKKVLIMFLCLVLVFCGLTGTMFASAEENVNDVKLIYAKVPTEWQNPCVWTFTEDGTSAFEAWPGQEMKADEVNEGWYYLYVPSNMAKVIVNANEGTVQTKDSAIENKDAWITVDANNEATVSYDKKTVGDNPKYVAMINVKAFVPTDWTDVNYWAWSHPDGTNAFANWPGKEATLGSDGWYSLQVPAFVNKIIVNANSGAVQTIDLDLDSASYSDAFIPNVYVVVDKDSIDMTKASGEVSYGDKPDVTPKFTIHTKIPENWALPCLWAWSHPDGTNAFANWPGSEMVEGDEWYTLDVPTFVNRLIISGNLGDVQTVDIEIEAKDLYVVVDGVNEEGKYQATVTYEIPTQGLSTFDIIGIVLLVAGALAVVVIVVVKMKNKRK